MAQVQGDPSSSTGDVVSRSLLLGITGVAQHPAIPPTLQDVLINQNRGRKNASVRKGAVATLETKLFVSFPVPILYNSP